MKVYYQVAVNKMGSPPPNRYRTARKLSAVKKRFAQDAGMLDNVLGFYEGGVSKATKLYVWCGEPEGMEPCSAKPDYIFSVGPRGGLKQDK